MQERAPRNKTLALTQNEVEALTSTFLNLNSHVTLKEIEGRVICQDTLSCIHFLPDSSIDLLVVDPPYNLTKKFNGSTFNKMTQEDYELWMESWFSRIISKVKETGTVYVCGDWQSSSSVEKVLRKYLIVRNRITWERDKGRGAKTNWKNCSEDIWFATKSDNYVFNVDHVKLLRRVITPYKDEKGKPKDWEETKIGRFRLSHPSNLWADITIPFWSMSENTDHPTQKPEKLIAKLILASSNEGDFIFDPFCGSGTTLVVAKKLNRRFCGIDIDNYYCALSSKRLKMADADRSIQGYSEGVFWERNSTTDMGKKISAKPKNNGAYNYEIEFD